MDWEEQLITLYLKICKEYQTVLWTGCQRFTNGGRKSFTDEEVMLIYLIGIIRGFRCIKDIHSYAVYHLSTWFPSLPKYSAYVDRLNRLHDAFCLLIDRLQSEKVQPDDESFYLIDSFPIVLAKHQHAYQAKVAKELASKSYNSTKKMYYYGVRAHMVARSRPGTLPVLEMLVIEEAARQDGPVFDQIRLMLHDNLVVADQAYKRPDEKEVELTQNLKVLTPCKKSIGQKKLEPQQQNFSNIVSRLRQPIEALFGWINRKTGIEYAGLVRSSAGLLTHIFGRIAAAMMIRNFL